MKRIYYRLDLTLLSPLALSSGENEKTDSDAALDSRGKPYIPASSLAGILASVSDKDVKNKIYGYIIKADSHSDKSEAHASSVIFYDCELTNEAVVSLRDSVALKNKVAKDGAKFDFEIVETGAEFRGYIEITDKFEDAEKAIENALSRLHGGELRAGKKSTRGYGRIGIKSLKKAIFTDPEKWLDFDMFSEECWNDAEKITPSPVGAKTDNIRVELSQNNSALSIRRYTTEAPKSDKDIVPDFKALSLEDGTPVIPGTSWAGAFRERFEKFCGETAAKSLFGYLDQGEKNGAQKSKIIFNESKLSGFEKKLITRNSIDRFSAGTNDGALYTERTVYNGKTMLEISFPSDTDKSSKVGLLAVLEDLDNGILAVGGMTSVGRGLFRADKIFYNGKDITESFKRFELEKIISEVGV